MNQIKYRKTYSFLCLSLIIFTFSLTNQKALSATFNINLHYDSKSNNLTFDKTKSERVFFNKNQEIDIRGYFEEQEKASGSYEIKIVDAKDYESEVGFFNKKNGSFTVEIPYYSVGKTLNIYNTKTKYKVLSTDISAFNTCNSNGICEYERGETLNNCIDDCGTSEPKYSDQTLELLKKNGGEIKNSQTGEVLLNISNPAKEETTPLTSQPKEPGASLTPIEQPTETPQDNKSGSVIIIIAIVLLMTVGIFAAVYLMHLRKNKK